MNNTKSPYFPGKMKPSKLIMVTSASLDSTTMEMRMLRIKCERLKELLAKYTDWVPGIGIKPIQKPKHGNCCTCQSCGQYHDECICEHNAIEQAIADIEAGKCPH
jgi:hypothetical protein